MKAARQRLVAQFKDHPPIEVHRGRREEYLTEGSIRSLTENMGIGWAHWIEQPMADHDAIGRMVRHTPALGRPVDTDDDLVIEAVEPEPVRGEMKI